MVLQILSDLVQVSRPGWWLVTLWLYLAPVSSKAEQAIDLSGLLVSLLPLNALLYAINDFADQATDLGNPRKGNWIFGPKGWSTRRIQLSIVVSSLLVLSAMIAWSRNEDQGRPLWHYLAWFVGGVSINVLYNTDGWWLTPPFHVIWVYLGYSIVTVLSSWRHHESSQDLIMVHRNQEGDLEYMSITGCNPSYWIHLAFLIVRTQLWTEYMDYDSDGKLGMAAKATTKRNSWLSHLESKEAARTYVTLALFVELIWTTYKMLVDSKWRTLWAFSFIGLGSFIHMEYLMAPKQEPNVNSAMKIAVMQSVGGIYLLYDCWARGIFLAENA